MAERIPKGLKRLKARLRRAKHEERFETLVLYLYQLSMDQTLQTIVECDGWADTLQAVSEAVRIDYGSAS